MAFPYSKLNGVYMCVCVMYTDKLFNSVFFCEMFAHGLNRTREK